MKVFNLGCTEGHRFEGWFASEADYLAQAGRGLTACPLCGSGDVQRLPSAPHVHRPRSTAGAPPDRSRPPEPAQSHGHAEAAATDAGAPAKGAGQRADDHAGVPALLQAAHLQAMRRVLADTPDVGEQFPEEARRMHYGDAPERAIRGRATADEARALVEEGIPVLPLRLPPALKGTLQ